MAFSGKVAVLMGGVGSEREVSLNSGENVVRALTSEGIDACGVDITPENMAILDDKSIDIFFIMLHGTWGEDGSLQSELEAKGLRFTGSDSKSSKMSFDKIKTKEILKANNLPTPHWITIDKDSNWESVASELENMGEKVVIKPACEGSSTGVMIVDKSDALQTAQQCTAKYGRSLIEKFIKAREFTVGILAGDALPLIEICPKESFYDYNAKYISDSTEYLFDTLADGKLISDMQQSALKCFEAMGCRGFSRVDFLLTEDNSFYILEINTIPGFTSHSLLPKAAEKSGLSQGQLCVKILESAE
ncbi:MAG: D-alanine--D-alanine ligase [Sedimentisphaeraceae bacterium JB056]